MERKGPEGERASRSAFAISRFTSRASSRRRPAGRAPGRLHGDHLSLAEALEQIGSGVPLNWGQIGEDDALATLQYLSPLATEYVSQTGHAAPPALRREIIADLSARLPKPKPKPVRQVPTTLAGFSEQVQVLTQVEEEVPSRLITGPQWIGASALAAAGVALVFWVISLFLPPPPVRPAYRWVEARRGEEIVLRQEDRGGWSLPVCQGYSLADPDMRRSYVSIPDDKVIQGATGFPILYLPFEISPGEEPVTHTMRLTAQGLSSCESTEPDTLDAGTGIRTEYLASTRGATGRGRLLTRVKVFQVNRVPVRVDVRTGEWREVEVEGGRGIYWEGKPYQDVEGDNWRDGAKVLVVEKGDAVVTIVADGAGRIDLEALVDLASKMSPRESAPAGGRCRSTQ